MTGPQSDDHEPMSVASLAGKSALITGCASGLGKAISERFVAEGANVLGLDRHAQLGETVMAEIGAKFQAGDVSNETDIAGAVSEIVSGQGRLDVIVNNAAIQVAGPLHETTEGRLGSRSPGQPQRRVLRLQARGHCDAKRWAWWINRQRCIDPRNRRGSTPASLRSGKGRSSCVNAIDRDWLRSRRDSSQCHLPRRHRHTYGSSVLR